MALAAALARLLHGPLPRAAPAAVSVPVLSYRSRLLCGVPATDDDPSGSGEAEQWKEAEAVILRDISPVVKLVKGILRRYENGGLLGPNDEKVIVEKLLSHHPRAEDKIGCGLDAIMVDRHPEFKQTRCLFIVRTNGHVEDFSYRKCLQAYIKEKYPSHADRFLQKHLKK